MGYRQYFKVVPKKTVNALKRCKTEEELYNKFVELGFKAERDEFKGEVSYYCPVYNIPGAEFEFGKYYDNAESLNRLGKPVYKGESAERYFEFGLVYGGEELILDAIKWQEEHIKEMYTHLVNNTFFNSSEKFFTECNYKDKNGKVDTQKMHYERLLNHCEEQLEMNWSRKFGRSILNTNRDSYEVTNSWTYELSIFNLVMFYKNFNPKKDYVIFYGY